MGRGQRLQRASFACRWCDKTVDVIGSKLRDYPSRPARRFCSVRCSALDRLNRRNLFKCEQCGRLTGRRTGKPNSGHRRLRFCSKDCGVASRESRGHLDKHGYRVFVSRGHIIPEHRIVMEGVIGRELRPFETVHHRNGIRDDNRRENLELWDSRNPKGQRVPDKIAWCVEYLIEHGYAVTPPAVAGS